MDLPEWTARPDGDGHELIFDEYHAETMNRHGGGFVYAVWSWDPESEGAINQLAGDQAPTEQEAMAAALGFIRAKIAGQAERFGLLLRWIPVGERLPEEFVRVLILEPHHGEATAIYGNGVWVDSQYDVIVHHPTHWMPLPSRPRV